ncbi:MAG: secE [Solirubrobacterales bacterium]|jgi:preprotein translocase SecE subunit|nr:secE [Solirubrobacterales bacterium]
MAKTRAQRKAERRRKQAQAERDRQAGRAPADEGEREAQAQRDTQAPVSGEVAEAEAVMQTGARPEDYGEHTVEHDSPGADGAQARSAAPGVTPEPVTPEPVESPAAPAPSRADVGAPVEAPEEPGESRRQRRERKRREKEERRNARDRELARAKAQAEKPDKRRRGVFGFIASCWAELKKVQWPDRDTLVQASAVTIIFVAVMAAYLGALDGAFNWLIKQLL